MNDIVTALYTDFKLRNGFDCYVQPEPVTGLDQGYFQPPPQPLGPPQAVINVGMGPEINVEGFKVHYEMTRPTSAVAATLDAATKAVQPALAPVSTRVPMGKAIVDESSWAVEASGSVGLDLGILRPGKLINVRGAGRLFSGSYLATRIAHSLDRDGSYTQTFRARRDAVGMTGAELYVALP